MFLETEKKRTWDNLLESSRTIIMVPINFLKTHLPSFISGTSSGSQLRLLINSENMEDTLLLTKSEKYTKNGE